MVQAAALAQFPDLLRAVSRPLQRLAPVLRVGRVVVVFRYDDVCAVLARDEDFTVAEVNAASMDRVNGPFVLGMDRGPTCLWERALLERCVEPGDLLRVRELVRAAAAELMDAADGRGRVDVVQELARPVAARLVGTWFGVPGPDGPTLVRWMRALFHETFLNAGGDPAVRRAGEAAAREFHAYADALVAQRRAEVEAGQPVPDDLVTRLVVLSRAPEALLSDEGVRRNLGGVVVGALETTTKATALAVDQLLRHPQALAVAQQAARDGDVERVTACTFEALRFAPLSPALVRHVARDTVLVSGTGREERLRAGQTLYLAALPAMFDPASVEDPQAFRPDRQPRPDLHFGSGLHRCWGSDVNAVVLPELVAALLRRPGVRRAPGRAGRIAYDGPFPDRLLLELGPSRAA